MAGKKATKKIVAKNLARVPDARYASMGIDTACLHAGEGLGVEGLVKGLRPIVTPVYRATTYRYDSAADMEDFVAGGRAGYAYARWGTVSSSALETAIATLVGGGSTMATASGMAANFAALQAAGLGSGKTLLASKEVYGNTSEVIEDRFAKFGVESRLLDFKDLPALRAEMRRTRPAVVFFEVLTNPTLSVIDAPAVIAMAHEVGARVVVDNTFATPYLYHPFLDGADFETHSLTKFINGHGDVLGGSVTCVPECYDALERIISTQGCVLAPDSAMLAMRAIKTFGIRIRRQCENAAVLAEFLAGREEVENVRFPGLPSHPNHETAKRIFGGRGYGGMICFDLRGGRKEDCFKLVDSLRLVVSAGSLGDVMSLIVHPSSTTHHFVPEEEKVRMGLKESTLRVSVGIEDPEDLVADFARALGELGRRPRGAARKRGG